MGLERQGAILSKQISSSATVTTAGKTGLLYGVNLQVATAESSVIIENGGAGGTEIVKLAIDASVGSSQFINSSRSIMFKEPVICTTDIYATIAGTGAVANVFYKEIES